MAALGLSKCRLCLKLGEFYSIFAEDNSMQLARMAMACSQIEIYEGDGLPDKICSECIEKLSAAFIFKQQCERSDAELRKCLKINISFPAQQQSSEKEERRLRASKRNRSEEIKYPTNLLEERYSVDIENTLSLENTQIAIKKRRLSESENSYASTSRVQSPQPKKKIRCNVCHLLFKTNKGLGSHKRMHQRVGSFVKTEEKIKIKEANEEATSTLICKHCNLNTDCKETFMNHLHNCAGNDEGLFECPRCTRIFKKNYHLIQHLDRSKMCDGSLLIPIKQIQPTVDKPQCPNCNMSMDSYAIMLRHFYKCVNVRGLKKMACNTCNTNYLNKKAFIKHIRFVHIGNNIETSSQELITIQPAKSKPLQCHKCSKTFNNHKALVAHLNTHLNDVNISKFVCPYKCNKCGKKYRFNASLYKHMKVHHSSSPDSELEQKPNKCEFCGKCFQYSKSLKIHKMNKHQMEMASKESMDVSKDNFNYSNLSSRCMHCNLILADKYERKQHNQVHVKNNEKPKNEYTCPECGLKFTNTRTFQMHYKVHENSTNNEYNDESVLDASISNFCEVTSEIPNEPDAEIELKSFSNYNSEQSQSSDNGFVCAICNESFNTSKAYKKHIKKHANDTITDASSNIMTCMVCSQKFDNENDHRQHMREHYYDKNIDTSLLVCKLCKKPSKNMRSYIAHKSWHMAFGSYECLICNTTFPFINYYKKHMKGKHNVNIKESPTVTKHKCPMCKHCFDSSISLQYHITCHRKGDKSKGKKEFKCKQCSQKFLSKNALEMHMLTLHKSNYETYTAKYKKKYHCPLCGMSFIGYSGYYKHISTVHPKDKGLVVRTRIPIMPVEKKDSKITEFQCEFCQKYLNSQSDLQAHITIHDLKPNLYKCTICSNRTSSMKFHLVHLTKMHLHQYHLSNPLECEHCNKKFIRRQELRTHLQSNHDIHEDYVVKLDEEEALLPSKELKDFQCSICEKVLLNEKSYQRHILWHNERRCNYCFKYFNTKAFVATHVKHHCDKKKMLGSSDQFNKRMKCHICMKPFSIAVKLYCHLKVQHNAEPGSNSGVKKVTPCDFCFTVFKSEEAMLSHRRIHFTVTTVKCKFCDKIVRHFMLKKHKYQHLSESFVDNPIKCDHCEEKFISLKIYQSHLKNVHETKLVWGEAPNTIPEKCRICEKEFNNMHRHLMYHEKYKCSKCNKYFYSEILYKDHVCEVESDGEVVEKSEDNEAHKVKIKIENINVGETDNEYYEECEFCFKPYTQFNGKSKHAYNHYKSEIFGCRICNKRVILKTSLKYHYATHKAQQYDQNPLKCRLCSITFTKFQSYFDHMSNDHNSPETLEYQANFPPTECIICKKVFPNIFKHYRYHKNTQCGICLKYFLSYKLYVDHNCNSIKEDPDLVIQSNEDISGLIAPDFKFYAIERMYDEHLNDSNFEDENEVELNDSFENNDVDMSYNQMGFSTVCLKSSQDLSNGDNLSQTAFDSFSPVISSTISLSSENQEINNEPIENIHIKSEPMDPVCYKEYSQNDYQNSVMVNPNYDTM